MVKESPTARMRVTPGGAVAPTSRSLNPMLLIEMVVVRPTDFMAPE